MNFENLIQKAKGQLCLNTNLPVLEILLNNIALREKQVL